MTMALQANLGHLLAVLDYVSYRPSTEVQGAALGIFCLVAARMPGLAGILAQMGPEGDQSSTHSATMKTKTNLSRTHQRSWKACPCEVLWSASQFVTHSHTNFAWPGLAGIQI